MALTSNDETDLLLPLMQSGSAPAPFATFLERLLRRTRAQLAGIAVLDSTASAARCFERGHIPVATGAREWPLALERVTLEALRPNRVYALAEVLDTSPPARENVFRRLTARGLGDARIVRLSENAGAQGWFYLARDGEGTASDSALLSNLTPYVTAATVQLLAAEHLSRTAHLSSAALAGTGWSWSLADPVTRTRSDNTPLAVAGHEANGRETLFLPLADGEEGAGLLLRHTGEIDLAEAARRLAALHRMPQREAELAAAMAAGQSIAEAGAAMGLTLETARNYSKRIYARLGVSGQPALCAKVWRGVAMLP